jgi:hypothetical protein
LTIASLEDRLSPKIKLFLKPDPFGQTTGIEIGKTENGDDAPFIQVCVEPMTEAAISDPVPSITKIEHRKSEAENFQEVFGISRPIAWDWQKGAVTLSKGKPLRFNVVRYDNKSTGLSDITDTAYKLTEFYSSTGKAGEYRYTVHVEGRDIVPVEAHVYVRWRVRGHPVVTLEPIAPRRAAAT